MRLLRLITWPYVRRHKLRTVLTTVGIVLGVAVFIGMHTANQSVLYAFYKTVDRIAGKAELQITAGEGGFPEAVLERVQALPEVKVAVPVIEAPVDTGLKGEGNLLILAVDMTGDRSLRDYDLESGEDAVIDDPLVFLAQPDSLMVTREFAERNGLAIGTKVPMRTMDGEKQFTVRGIMKSGGLTQAFGGNLAVMDIYAAQMVFGRGRTFDRVDLALNPGVSLAAGPHGDRDGPRARATRWSRPRRAASRSTRSSASTRSRRTSTAPSRCSSGCSSSTTRSRSPWRSGGARSGSCARWARSREQIRNAVPDRERAVGAGGIARRPGVRRAAVARAGDLHLEPDRRRVRHRRAHDGIARDPRLMIVGLVMGVVTSVVAGFIPARNAARVDPIQALQKGRSQAMSAGENRTRRVAAIVLGAASARPADVRPEHDAACSTPASRWRCSPCCCSARPARCGSPGRCGRC